MEALIWVPWVGNLLRSMAYHPPARGTITFIPTRTIAIMLEICTIRTRISDDLRALSLINMIHVSRGWLVICGHHLFSRFKYCFSLYSCTYSSELISLGVAGSGYTPCFPSQKFPSMAYRHVVFGPLGFSALLHDTSCWCFRKLLALTFLPFLSFSISFVIGTSVSVSSYQLSHL